MTQESDGILTRAEVAALLRCSEPHVVKLVKTAGLPGVQLGDRRAPWRFRARRCWIG